MSGDLPSSTEPVVEKRNRYFSRSWARNSVMEKLSEATSIYWASPWVWIWGSFVASLQDAGYWLGLIPGLRFALPGAIFDSSLRDEDVAERGRDEGVATSRGFVAS